jgi:hypothetical protein
MQLLSLPVSSKQLFSSPWQSRMQISIDVTSTRTVVAAAAGMLETIGTATCVLIMMLTVLDVLHALLAKVASPKWPITREFGAGVDAAASEFP